MGKFLTISRDIVEKRKSIVKQYLKKHSVLEIKSRYIRCFQWFASGTRKHVVREAGLDLTRMTDVHSCQQSVKQIRNQLRDYKITFIAQYQNKALLLLIIRKVEAAVINCIKFILFGRLL